MSSSKFFGTTLSAVVEDATQALSRSPYAATLAEHHDREAERLATAYGERNASIREACETLRDIDRELQRLTESARYSRQDADLQRRIAELQARRDAATQRRAAALADRTDVERQREGLNLTVNTILTALTRGEIRELAPGEPLPRRRTGARVDVAALGEAERSLQAARDELARLETERSVVAAQGMSRNALVECLHAAIDAAHAAAVDDIGQRLRGMAQREPGNASGDLLLSMLLFAPVRQDAIPRAIALGLHSAELKRLVTAASVAVPPGLEPEQRAAKLADIDARIAGLQVEAERLARSVEEVTGVYCPRHASAPAVVLLRAELPQ